MLFSEQTPEELPYASDLQYCHSVNNNQNRAASKKGMTAVGAMAAYLERSWRAEFALKAVAAIHGDSIETKAAGYSAQKMLLQITVETLRILPQRFN